MAPSFDEKHLNLLVGLYIQAAEQLASLLEEMNFSQGSRQHTIYAQVLRILRELRTVTSQWGATAIDEFFRRADKREVTRIAKLISDRELKAEFTQIHEGAVDALVRGMLNDVDKAFTSISVQAQRILRGSRTESAVDAEMRRQTALGLAAGESREGIRRRIGQTLRKQYRDGIVAITGSNGRTYRYSLDYYASLVGHQTQRQAMTLAVLMRAQENGFDLVRVSPNPSTVGDYCDAYRGRVFSISGSDARFPPLALTPNGGPPFHPWCKHSIHTFVPELYDDEAVEEFSDVNPDFLLKPGEQNHKRILKMWMEAKEDNPDLGSLSHI